MEGELIRCYAKSLREKGLVRFACLRMRVRFNPFEGYPQDNLILDVGGWVAPSPLVGEGWGGG